MWWFTSTIHLKSPLHHPQIPNKRHDGKSECLLAMWQFPGSKFGLVKSSRSWKLHTMKYFFKLGQKSFKDRFLERSLTFPDLNELGKSWQATLKLSITGKNSASYSLPLWSPGWFIGKYMNFRVSNTSCSLHCLRIVLSLCSSLKTWTA